MKIIKECFTSLLLIAFIFQSGSFAYAETSLEETILINKVDISRTALKSISRGEKYIKSIDTVIATLSKSEKKLQKLSKRLSLAQGKLSGNNSLKAKKTLKIVNYLASKVKLALLQYDTTELILKEFETSTLSRSEQEKVNDKLVKIQLNLLNKGTKGLEKLIKDFEELSNYEAKGDLRMNLDIDQEKIGTIKAEFKLDDYIVKASNFDSQVEGHISALLDAAPKGQDAIKLEFKNFLDFISKDGNMYVLIKDLDIISEENIDNFKDTLDKLEEIAKENKYIKYNDKNSEQAMKILRSLAPHKVLADGKEILSQPMFQAYKKDGDKYYLTPTRYACDSLKELANKFDPFNGRTCSDSQYNNMLREFAKTGSMYIELGTYSKLGFEGITKTGIDNIEGFIIFSDSDIKEASINISPDQARYPNENFTLDYKKNSHLNIDFYANKGEADIIFTSTLSNNKFTMIEYKGNISSSKNELKTTLNLKNKKILGDFEYSNKEYKYNYDTRKGSYVPSKKVSGNISGATNSSNELQNLVINYDGTDLKTNTEYLDGSFDFSKPKISFINHYNGKYYKSDISLQGVWHTTNKNFSDLDLDFKSFAKEKEYNYDTYKYELTGKEYETAHSSLTLKNTIITGTTVLKTPKGEDFISISTDGSYEKDYLILNNNFSIDPKVASIFDKNTQIEKARDSVRVTDVLHLISAIEQSYQDNGEYPTKENFHKNTSMFLSNTPKDPSGAIEINGCKFGYIYEVGSDKNGIKNQKYKLSTCFEANSNIVGKAMKDGGSDNKRYERGIDIQGNFNEKFYINTYSTWEQKEINNTVTEVTGNLNIDVDQRGNKDNENIYFNINVNDANIIKFEMDNTSTIDYKKVEIDTPTNTVDFKEVLK
ncbi:hypothetical protein A9Q91_00280 [Candidatus Gracilibacteria bacterium 28_42_T64]|nr:hypothetical protein A9Q91_00280 [Candidatus Gracilibacteria bacterium 28_42_T64]